MTFDIFVVRGALDRAARSIAFHVFVGLILIRLGTG
jgi:hypothetical protein